MLLFFHNKVFANSPWMVIFMQLFDKCKFFFSSSSRLPNCHLPKVSSCRYRKSFFSSLSLFFFISTTLHYFFFLQTLRMQNVDLYFLCISIKMHFHAICDQKALFTLVVKQCFLPCKITLRNASKSQGSMEMILAAHNVVFGFVLNRN